MFGFETLVIALLLLLGLFVLLIELVTTPPDETISTNFVLECLAIVSTEVEVEANAMDVLLLLLFLVMFEIVMVVVLVLFRLLFRLLFRMA